MNEKIAELSGLLITLGTTLAEFGTVLMKEGNPPLAEVPEAPSAPAETTKPLPKLEDVRTVLADISRTGKTAEMKELLTKFGAKKLSDIPAEKYPELLRAAEAIRDA